VIKGFLEKWTLKQVQGDGDIEGNGDDGGGDETWLRAILVMLNAFPHLLGSRLQCRISFERIAALAKRWRGSFSV